MGIVTRDGSGAIISSSSSNVPKFKDKKKKVFIICSVRMATACERKSLEEYAKSLEDQGYMVHLPHRDTDQLASGFDICLENGSAIYHADEIHIFYNENSTGTHFDMGVAFALQVLVGMDKDISVINGGMWTEKKSFKRMLMEWQKFQNGEDIE